MHKKNSVGVQILTLKKGSVMTNVAFKSCIDCENIETYRKNKIPTSGVTMTKKIIM